MLLVLKMVFNQHTQSVWRWTMYYHQHCVEIHLEVKNVLPRRDHGLAGAYCGRCRHPDVHVWESSPLPLSRRESILVIVIITTIQMYLYHSYMHFHVWLCFVFVAIILPHGSILPSWHHRPPPLTHGHGYGIMDLPVFNVWHSNLYSVVFCIRGHHPSPYGSKYHLAFDWGLIKFQPALSTTS